MRKYTEEGLNELIRRYGFEHKKVIKYAQKLNKFPRDLKKMQYRYLVTIEDRLGCVGSWSCREEWYNDLDKAIKNAIQFANEIRYATIEIKDNETNEIIQRIITE